MKKINPYILLQFFKTNANYQIFSLIILIVLVRLPNFIYGTPLLIPEFRWLIIGEQLAAGKLLYVDVFDNIGPLSGYVYALIHYFSGRSVTALHVTAFVITIFQVFYFTLLAHRKGIFRERNYVPGLILILFYSLSFDFATLSPALMGTTFLFLAFGSFLNQLERFGASDEVFEIGVYIGISFLFYPPLCLFFLWVLVSLNLYTGASLRAQFLVIFGFIFPITLVSLWYFIDNHFANFNNYFLKQVFEKRQYNISDFAGLFTTLFLPIATGVLGFFAIIGSSKYSNFQTRAQQLILLWFVTSLLSIAFMPFLAPMQFIPFVFPLAYFTILYFSTFKKKWSAEISFIFLFIGILFLNYQAFIPKLDNTIFSKLEKLQINPKKNTNQIIGKKILVLGNNLEPYYFNKPATPYVNWNIAKSMFLNINNYENVIDIIQNFEKDPPEYIFDQENLFPKVFERIPDLNKKYEKIGEGLFKLRKA